MVHHVIPTIQQKTLMSTSIPNSLEPTELITLAATFQVTNTAFQYYKHKYFLVLEFQLILVLLRLPTNEKASK